MRRAITLCQTRSMRSCVTELLAFSFALCVKFKGYAELVVWSLLSKSLQSRWFMPWQEACRLHNHTEAN
jgi:hypothetical protein